MPARIYWFIIPFVFIGSQSKADDSTSFVTSIAPLLQTQCVACHDAELAESDYRLDTYKHLMRLGDGSPAVIGEQPEKSKLFQVLVHEDVNSRMPSESDPLPDASINLIRRWIKEGATFDGESQDQQLSALLPTRKHPQAPEKYPDTHSIIRSGVSSFAESTFCGRLPRNNSMEPGWQLLGRIDDQGERTYSIDLHPTLPRILSASGTPGILGEVRTFDLSTGELLSVVVATDEVIMDARYSPDGNTIAVAMPDGSTRLIDHETGTEKRELLGHSDQVISLSWHADGERIVTASRDHTAKVFDAKVVRQWQRSRDTPNPSMT